MLTRNGRPLDAEEIIGRYGQNWTEGLISEHVEHFVEAGGTVDGPWARVPDGRIYPVLCSEIIRVDTEDGPVSGRCGRAISPRTEYLCERHG